jgi:uncharacterized protein YdhG (YjbR/CyaY superfamily)
MKGNVMEQTYKTIDEYIQQYPPEVQERLQILRKVIKEAAPQAEERISWQMPTFFLQGNLIHFAVQKNHIGLYPGKAAVEAFKDELSEYKCTIGGIQLPFNKTMPYALIEKIVHFGAAENLQLAEDKKRKSNRKRQGE